MKKRFVFLILTAMLAGMTAACAKKEASTDKPASESREVSEPASSEKSVETSAHVEEKPLTLEESELRFVYAKDNFVAVAFHGPEDIGMSFCQSDGSELAPNAFLGYGDLGNGWTLGITYELSENYTADDLGLSVSDYDAEKMPDGTYAERLFPDLGEPMTEEELKEIGFSFLDGACCIVGNARGIYGKDCFGMFFSISFFDDNHGKEPDEIEGFRMDRFSFFAGDGTPLGEYFDGYTLKLEPRHLSMYVYLYQDDGTKDEAKNKSMCAELKACHPYAVYTGADGQTHQFPFFEK